LTFKKVIKPDGNAFCYLGHFQRMGDSIPKEVALVPGKELCLSLEPAKGWRG
jgi:hypothetical protein